MTERDRRKMMRLLEEAKKHPIFVHRYKWSHDERRRLTRRMCKDGLLVMIEHTGDGFRYRAAELGRTMKEESK